MGLHRGKSLVENPRIITSLQNDRVKAVRALEMRKVRRETGLFVAEGVSILETARQAGFRPETLVYLKGSEREGVTKRLVDDAVVDGVECLEVSAAVLGKLASKDNPQSVMGVFRQRWSSLPKPDEDAASSVWLALDEIRDPGNLGSIVRTVDAVGAEGIILIDQCCDPYSHEAVRASMGSIFSVQLARAEQMDFCTWCETWPGDVVGLHLKGQEDFREVAYRQPVLVLMGSEGRGLSAALSDRCSKLVKIPMAGTLDSLNLSVATALTLYQVCGSQLRLHD